MGSLDWLLVAFGAVVAAVGVWIQLHPDRLYPRLTEGWQIEPATLSQLRLLGGSFTFMGIFFLVQMTVDLLHLPWWEGMAGGLVAGVVLVSTVRAMAHRRHRRRRLPIQQSSPEKMLELR